MDARDSSLDSQRKSTYYKAADDAQVYKPAT